MTDHNLQFIKEKICEVRSAIMYSQCNDLIHLPNSIVKAVRVDDEGQVWFLCDRPSQQLDQYTRQFPARLKFYKKGTFFHLEVSGRAEIVNNSYNGSSPESRPLLLKMNMQSIEYNEVGDKKKPRWELWLEKAYAWTLTHIGFNRQEKSVLARLQPVNHS